MIPLIITAVLFFIIGQRLPYWLGYLVKKIYQKRILVKPIPVDQTRLCKEPHKWVAIPHTMNQDLEFENVNVCNRCGFVPAIDQMVTDEGLKRMEYIKKVLEHEKEIVNEFSLQEEQGIKKAFAEELASGVELRKLEKLYLCGQTMRERFILYRLSKQQPKPVEADDGRRS